MTLFDELDRVHREGAPWLLKEPDQPPRPREWLAEILSNGDVELFVADAGRPVGLASVALRRASEFAVFVQQHHALIDDLVVHADWRRKGVGRRLYDACEAWARDRKVARIDVNVYEFNDEARGFYAAVGFETSMRRMRKAMGP